MTKKFWVVHYVDASKDYLYEFEAKKQKIFDIEQYTREEAESYVWLHYNSRDVWVEDEPQEFYHEVRG